MYIVGGPEAGTSAADTGSGRVVGVSWKTEFLISLLFCVYFGNKGALNICT